MTVETPRRPTPTAPPTPTLVRVGTIVAIIGLVGAGLWAFMAWFDASYGSVGDHRVCEAVGVPDPVGEPEVWECLSGSDRDSRVLYTGSQTAILALDERAAQLHQADLRVRWLYPSVGLVVVGLGVIAYGYRRELDAVTDRSDE